MKTEPAITAPSRRLGGTFAMVLGLALPASVLAFGWAYASVRENRIKERLIAEMDRRGDPAADYERSYIAWHYPIEMTCLGGLCVLLVASGVVTIRAFRAGRELAQKKTAFIAAVTHELRTPLTTLRLHAEMLEQELVPEDRKARVHQELVREASRLARLVENVLAMSKLEEGKWSLAPKRAELGPLVEEVVGAARAGAEERGFTVELVLEPGVFVELDARAVEIAVGNLIDNAIKYGGSEARKRILIEVRSREDGAVVVVRDHGPGIPPADRERVFDRFARGREDAKPGVGLGLSLVRELMRAQGGDARVLDSSEGAAIELSLPRDVTSVTRASVSL